MHRNLMAVAVAGLALGGGRASAHAFLKKANPAVGSTLEQAPDQVVIDFTEGVEPRFSTIIVQDASGARMDQGAAHLDGGEARLAIGLKPLKPGTYLVVWHVVATDTHKTEGRFTFSVKS